MSHVHDWALAEDPAGPIGYLCVECADRTPACNTCQRPTGTELLICDRCLDHERKVLGDIEHALGLYVASVPSVLKAVRYDVDRIDGTPGDYQDDPTAITTPADVMDVLASWAQAWADALGYPVNLALRDWLTDHLLWAAQNPDASGWSDYRGEVRQLRHHARRIAGLLPVPHPAPCVHCGGTIVQDRADENWEPLEDGLSDTLRCTGCAMTWGDRDRVTALAVQVASTMDPNPDAEVTEAQARALVKVGTSTIRQWVRRGQLARAGTRKGVATYRLGDIIQLADGLIVDAAG